MIIRRLTAAVRWVRRAITQPRSELDRWERAARGVYDLGLYGARQLRQDRAPVMAAALAFRTLFGLLPVLVVSTVLVNSFRGADAFKESVTDFIRAAGLYEISTPVDPRLDPGLDPGKGTGADPAAGATDGATGADAGGEAAGETMTFGLWLEQLLDQASSLNLAAIGWVGVLVLIYSAIGLMVTVENSFNAILRAPSGRNWFRRVPTYFTVLLGWPLAVGLITYFEAQFTAWLAEAGATRWMLSLVPTAWSFAAIWLVMITVYRMVPNALVRLQPAIAGAFVATLLMLVGVRSLLAYMKYAISIRQLYGSLGLIPLFMFWVYVMWLFILFGLEFSAILQKLRGRRIEEMERMRSEGAFTDPSSVVGVMGLLASRYAAGHSTNHDRIERELGLQGPIVTTLVQRLEDAGLVHRLAADAESLVPARPAEAIDAIDLLELGFELVDRDGEGDASPIVLRLREAQLDVARGKTLAELVRIPAPASPEPGPSDESADGTAAEAGPMPEFAATPPRMG